jgi:hypothetical protein
LLGVRGFTSYGFFQFIWHINLLIIKPLFTKKEP